MNDSECATHAARCLGSLELTHNASDLFRRVLSYVCARVAFHVRCLSAHESETENNESFSNINASSGGGWFIITSI